VVTDQSVDCVSPTRSAARRASPGLQGACAQAKFIPVINDRLERAAFTIADEPPYHRVGGLTAVPALLGQLGCDPVSVLAKAGLGLGSFDCPENHIPYSSLGRLLRESANRTGCTYFGLLAGRAWHLSDLGLPGQIASYAPTVRESLRCLTTYHHLGSQGGFTFLIERDGMAERGYSIYQDRVEGADQIQDLMLALEFNVMREFCDHSWVPSEVGFAHGKPPDVESYRRFFRAPLRFDAEYTAMRFPSYCMERAVESADPQALRLCQRQAAAAGGRDLRKEVHRALRTLLIGCESSGDDVAQMLSMHRRTLNRRLKAQGTTFHKELDRTRFKVARELLIGTHISLDDIAAALGYSSVSPFMRTFRRWTGTTPGRWRRSAEQSSRFLRRTMSRKEESA
jgi:AraC-like DNA-binding protein